MQPGLCLLLGIAYTISLPVWAEQVEPCLEAAATQLEMNRCSGVEFAAVDSELNRVFKKIQEVYKADKVLLKKLKVSQLAWIKLRDADIELKYPHALEPNYYGSVFPLCLSGFKTQLTMQRTEFLKQWLLGGEEGDVCMGSIKSK